MLSETPKTGFTLVELIVSMGIIAIVSTLVIVYVDPTDARSRFRDNKRISDISVLDRCVTEYYQDHESYPDSANILRNSTILPSGSSTIYNANMGWIAADFSPFTAKMPVDPLNDATYRYYYLHNGVSYELNALLEKTPTEMQNDGGNDPVRYEVGNNLGLISPN